MKSQEYAFAFLLTLAVSNIAHAACDFDVATLKFHGSSTEQARCLLRDVKPWGHIETSPASLPASLESRIGTSAKRLRSRLSSYLGKHGISAEEIGGDLVRGLSRANDNSINSPVARYFVIHDTSTLVSNAVSLNFPLDESPDLNNLSAYAGPNAVAHAFINRQGDVLLGHDFSIPWRATKFENKRHGRPVKGLFLHVELVQPRLRDKAVPAPNDALAPIPGFTASQYDGLAMLYVAASARGGVWMIPAYHAVIDEGFDGAHDDPQHFEIGRFASAVDQLVADIGGADESLTLTPSVAPQLSAEPWRELMCRLRPRHDDGLHPEAIGALETLGLGDRITQGLNTAHTPGNYHGPDGVENELRYTGAVDISVRCLSEEQIRLMLDSLATSGFAAWYRKPDADGWKGLSHVHAVWVDVPLKLKLRKQVWSWLDHRNGLVSNTPYKFWSPSDIASKAIRDRFSAANGMH